MPRTSLALLAFVVSLSFAGLFLDAYRFKDYAYEELQEQAKNLDGAYARVESASDIYGLEEAGQGFPSRCSPNVIRVTDLRSERADTYRPQLLISGEIHGDERVGPAASLETAVLLVNSAECEITKKQSKCELLDAASVTAHDRRWLAFLATRRETIIVPTANCLGHMKGQRNDGSVDPNRDFAYSRRDNKCFRSATSKLFYGKCD